jgi:hypothetical protein
MTTIIDGSGSATFATPLPLAQGGTGNTSGNVVSSQVADAFNATGSAPLFACRAWVNFNGTGTVAIRASGNVSSITDNAVGNYTVNFATAMSDANYVVGTAIGWNGSVVSSNSVAMIKDNLIAPSVSSFIVTTTLASNGSAYDVDRIFVSVFR